jgi:hypothetical protein
VAIFILPTTKYIQNQRQSHSKQNNANLASIDQTVLKLLHSSCFRLLPFYISENGGWQDSFAATFQENSVLSKMMPIWSWYLKWFKSYSIFKCWSSEIQDGGRRPKWRIFSTSLGRLISIVKRYIWAKGDVCSICSFVTIHFATYIHTSIQTSVDSITQIHS